MPFSLAAFAVFSGRFHRTPWPLSSAPSGRFAPYLVAAFNRTRWPLCAEIYRLDEHWLEAPQLKTRLAHGYCLIDTTQSPCPQANVCERCPGFVPLPEERETIERQLRDVRLLARDAQTRGWVEDINRHRVLAQRLQGFLDEISAHELTPRKQSTRA